MECQKIIHLLSPYLDGEVEPSQAKLVSEHLEHCEKCRDEWQTLQEISSFLHELPEVTPPPEFHAGLQEKLTKLTTAATTETFKKRVSPLQNFASGSWSKAVAYAAVLMLAFGVTALWYPEGLGLKMTPVAERYDAFSPAQQTVPTENEIKQNQIVEEDSAGIQSYGKEQLVNNQEEQKYSSQIDNNSIKHSETKVSANEFSLPDDIINQSESVRADVPGISRSVSPEELQPIGNNSIDSEANLQDRAESSANGTAPRIFSIKSEETGQVEQYSTQKIQKLLLIRLKVEDISNAAAEILILSQNSAALAEVEQNKLLITVPAGNLDLLIGQIESLGQVIAKEPLVEDENFEHLKLAEDQFYTIDIELQ